MYWSSSIRSRHNTVKMLEFLEFLLQQRVLFLRMGVQLSWTRCTRARNTEWNVPGQCTIIGPGYLECCLVCRRSLFTSITDQSRSRESTVPEVAPTGRFWSTFQPSRDRVTMTWVALTCHSLIDSLQTLARWLECRPSDSRGQFFFGCCKKRTYTQLPFPGELSDSGVCSRQHSHLCFLVPRVAYEINGEWHTGHVHNWILACLTMYEKCIISEVPPRFDQTVHYSTDGIVCIAGEGLHCLLRWYCNGERTALDAHVLTTSQDSPCMYLSALWRELGEWSANEEMSSTILCLYCCCDAHLSDSWKHVSSAIDMTSHMYEWLFTPWTIS